ncbi:MAG: sigma-70 family RNA polymerase sigma factor [Myxococcota bacterium]|nr:sigma-70 family RNA polymerase sigma factor [Myxococcota bacterium]
MNATDKHPGGGQPPPDDPDAAMVAAVLDGDPEAYRVLVERYERRIYHVVYGMVRSPEDAHDLAQDAFIKAFQNLHRFRLESKFYTWLCRIAMNVTIDHLRKQKHRRHSEFDDSRSGGSGGQVVRLHSAPDDPAANVAQSRMFKTIMDAVDTLPDDQKQVLVLRELEEMPYKEIAEILGIPEGTVMSRLYYARRRLQELLADHRPS